LSIILGSFTVIVFVLSFKTIFESSNLNIPLVEVLIVVLVVVK